MKKPSLLILSSLVLISTLLMSVRHSTVSASQLGPDLAATSDNPPFDCGGEPCDGVARGFRAFFDRRLHGLDGNGRSCADCHMATDHFQLAPSSVEARFQFLQFLRRRNPNADDPLFRPIDADDFRTNGENA